MEITEIRIKLMEGSEDRLRAFCSITIDQSFVVRDLKIIDGTNGPFVAMPSRKLTGHCNRCGGKNHLRAGYCNLCGTKQVYSSGNDAPQKLYADVAHPINSECREMIQNAVITEFEAELQRSAQPGYRSRYEDDFDAGEYDERDYAATSAAPRDAVPRVPAPRAQSTRAPSSHAQSTRTPTRRTPTASVNQSPSDETKVLQQTSRPTDQFGAGLFDTGLDTPVVDPPAVDTPAIDASIDQPDRETEAASEPRLARIDSGRPGKAVPPPHLSGDTSERERAIVPVDGRAADIEEPVTESPEEPQQDSGFGVGLFDG